MQVNVVTMGRGSDRHGRKAPAKTRAMFMQELIITSKELVLYYPIKFSFFIFHNIKISHIVSFVSKKTVFQIHSPNFSSPYIKYKLIFTEIIYSIMPKTYICFE